jgi:uncharacterized membrane protein
LNAWPLLGVAVVVVGFALRLNPVLVVVVAGIASGVASGMGVGDLLALLGTSFVSNRVLLLFTLTLPVIGLLERHGLRERAQQWIAGFRTLSLARLLVSYLAMRQLLSMFGLYDVAGHAQTVRPLLAPMAEQAAARDAPLDEATRARMRALAAATDNVGRFFGEDVFLAFAGVLLIQRFFDSQGIHLEPFAISLWALPTAIAAFVIHSLRVAWVQRRIGRARAGPDAAKEAGDAAR